MYPNELFYFIVLTITIVVIPFLPTNLLLLLDNLVIRIVIVIALIYTVHVGPTVGIFGLIMICLLYLERNHRKVSHAIKKLDEMDVHAPVQATVKQMGEAQQTVPVHAFDTPADTESDFMAHDDQADSVFEPVDASINQKSVLSSIYPLKKNDFELKSSADELFEQMGFGHVSNVVTVGEN